MLHSISLLFTIALASVLLAGVWMCEGKCRSSHFALNPFLHWCTLADLFTSIWKFTKNKYASAMHTVYSFANLPALSQNLVTFYTVLANLQCRGGNLATFEQRLANVVHLTWHIPAAAYMSWKSRYDQILGAYYVKHSVRKCLYNIYGMHRQYKAF